MPITARGVILPVLTVFEDDGEVDVPLLRDMVEWWIASGVHGLFPLGSAGQGPVMTERQRRIAAEAIVDQTAGRVPIILHVGTADTQTTVALARHAHELGVHAIAIVPPFYYSDHTEWEVVAHYAEVAAAVPDPLFIYDNPPYTGIPITPDYGARLVEAVPSLSGIKISKAPMEYVLEYVEKLPSSFSVFSGSIPHVLSCVPGGVKGIISPPMAPFPELTVALWEAVEKREGQRAESLQKQANAVAAAVNELGNVYGRSVHRELLRLRGFPVRRYPRWPSRPIEGSDLDAVSRILDLAEARALSA